PSPPAWFQSRRKPLAAPDSASPGDAAVPDCAPRDGRGESRRCPGPMPEAAATKPAARQAKAARRSWIGELRLAIGDWRMTNDEWDIERWRHLRFRRASGP